MQSCECCAFLRDVILQESSPVLGMNERDMIPKSEICRSEP
jgi:hypothetical protein